MSIGFKEAESGRCPQPGPKVHGPTRTVSSGASGFVGVALIAITVFLFTSVASADSLQWSKESQKVSADISAGKLSVVLEQIAAKTGWHVFVEPDVTHEVSAKFDRLPAGEALRLLLGDLNFALVPGTNSRAKLFVFRTTMGSATRLVRGANEPDPRSKAKPIPNELVVRLKRGVKIEDVARMLGAKVLGRIEGSNAYRLQFENEAAADAAREQLASNPDIASTDNNWAIDRPSPGREGMSGIAPPVQLQLKPTSTGDKVIIGLIDTAVQPLGGGLDKFLLQQVQVAGPAQLDPNTPAHGTTMAGVLLRGLEEVTDGTTSVQILPVDVYGANQYTTTFDVAAGFVTAVNKGAKIINMSLGSEGNSPFLHGIIQEATRQGITVMAAAGNEPVVTPYFPAAYPEVMGVTAVEGNGEIAPYANRGSFVTLGAPGTSTIYYNNQPYYVVGTSGATAFASGAAAGFMETTKSGPDRTRAFLYSNFGLANGSGR